MVDGRAIDVTEHWAQLEGAEVTMATIAGGYGDDVLGGGGGDDVMSGGIGADLFVFTSGSDRITDFANDIDTVQLDAAVGFTSVAQAMGFADQVGEDVVFRFTGGHVLTVNDTALAMLTDDDKVAAAEFENF